MLTRITSSTIASVMRGCRATSDHSKAGAVGSSGRRGMRPVWYTQTSRQEAATRSNTVSASSVEANVGTDVAGTRRRMAPIFTTSPPRAGAKALTPTPAR